MEVGAGVGDIQMEVGILGGKQEIAGMCTLALPGSR